MVKPTKSLTTTYQVMQCTRNAQHNAPAMLMKVNNTPILQKASMDYNNTKQRQAQETTRRRYATCCLKIPTSEIAKVVVHKLHLQQ